MTVASADDVSMAWMYILECSDGSLYVGSTEKDPEARVWEHNHDPHLSVDHTRKRRPVQLVYVEQFDRIDTAFARERQVHGWSRAKKLALIQGRGDDLPRLSRSRSRSPSGASTGSATGG